MTLEARITRLEKLLTNESSYHGFKPGDMVEDIDGYTGEVIDVGPLKVLYNKYKDRLFRTNIKQIRDIMNSNKLFSMQDAVAVCYDMDNTRRAGRLSDCSIWVDPENSLDLI